MKTKEIIINDLLELIGEQAYIILCDKNDYVIKEGYKDNLDIKRYKDYLIVYIQAYNEDELVIKIEN